MDSILRFQCAQTGCKFLALDTCELRIAKIASGECVEGVVPLDKCVGCVGPVSIKSGRVVNVLAGNGKAKRGRPKTWNTTAEHRASKCKAMKEYHARKRMGLLP